VFVAGRQHGKRVKLSQKKLEDLIKIDWKDEHPQLFQKGSEQRRFFRHACGYLLPTKDSDESKILIEKLRKQNGSKNLFIEKGLVNLYEGKTFAKVQWKYVPPNIDGEEADKFFSKFGNVEDLQEEAGIWTVAYKSLNWKLPFIYRKVTGRKRWTTIHESIATQISFASREICLTCKIKGHHHSICPGKELKSRLKKLEEEKKGTEKKNTEGVEKPSERTRKKPRYLEDYILGSSTEEEPQENDQEGGEKEIRISTKDELEDSDHSQFQPNRSSMLSSISEECISETDTPPKKREEKEKNKKELTKGTKKKGMLRSGFLNKKNTKKKGKK
jgi:hypothetical protein